MTNEELIKELQKLPPKEDVYFNSKYTEHCCEDNYCYCSEEDHVSSILTIDFYKDLRIFGRLVEKKSGIILQ